MCMLLSIFNKLCFVDDGKDESNNTDQDTNGMSLKNEQPVNGKENGEEDIVEV